MNMALRKGLCRHPGRRRVADPGNSTPNRIADQPVAVRRRMPETGTIKADGKMAVEGA